MGRRWLLVCILGLVVVTGECAWGYDSERPRAYLQLRGQDTNPWAGTHDAWGIAIGANFNRYVGAELSSDIFERRIKLEGAFIGEYGLASVVPQVRLRYPLFRGRLTPYVVGGVGVAFGEFNDRKPAASGRTVEVPDSFLVGTVGVGVEYFLADNIALGAEFKYLMAENQTFHLDGVAHRRNIDSLFTMVSLRLFYPERDPPPLAEARDPVPTRLYLAVRAGGAVPTRTSLGQGIVVRPEPPAYGGTFNQYFGAALGLNVGRYLGGEISFEGYEVVLAQRGVGHITEYAAYAFMPQVRVRYPLLGGRVVPYAVAGVGLAAGEVNDSKPAGAGIVVSPQVAYGLGAAVGAGAEYFVTSNIAFGVETRYVHTSLPRLRFSTGPRVFPDMQPVIVALTLRVFLKDF